MRQMLVITPHHNIVRLRDNGDGEHVNVSRAEDLYDYCYEREMPLACCEHRWLQAEGFVELIAGTLELDFDPELEDLCKTIELV
jgi:hypothetical protein